MLEFAQLLTTYGITPALILGAVGTVVASFFSARWGARETRRQFDLKIEAERQAAAIELIPLLMVFADECDRKKNNLSTWISSDGRDGEDESMQGMSLDPGVRAAAAHLSPQVARRAIKLEITKTRAETYISNVAGHVDREELNQYILSFFALLSLRARWVVDMAAKEAGLSISHTQDEFDELLKQSTKHAFEIDSGNDLYWH